MIRYRLRCTSSKKTSCKTEFESWFQSSDAFEKLRKAGQVNCPKCGSKKVEKALMAPSVKTTKGKSKAVARSEAGNKQAVASLTPEQRAFVEMARKIRDHVTANSEYVGDKFADEARKIHYEEVEERGIYGEATIEEAAGLAEEGIDVLPLPNLPEEQN